MTVDPKQGLHNIEIWAPDIIFDARILGLTSARVPDASRKPYAHRLKLRTEVNSVRLRCFISTENLIGAG